MKNTSDIPINRDDLQNLGEALDSADQVGDEWYEVTITADQVQLIRQLIKAEWQRLRSEGK